MQPVRRLLVVGALLASATVATAAQAQSSCPDPAGEHAPFDRVVAADGKAASPGQLDPARLDPDSDNPYDVIINGGGWGHGIGMSQYGARGAALLGCTHTEILETYFPGTTVTARDDLKERIRVGLWPSTPSGGDVAIINVQNQGGTDLVWTVSDVDAPPPPAQPPAATWGVYAEADGGFTLREGATELWRYTRPEIAPMPRLRADLDPTRVFLPSKGMDYQRGILEFAARGPSAMAVVVDLPVEQYLYGLGEVPSSWPSETLQAQAVAGRSYAVTSFPKPNCNCDLYDSVFDQAYVGASKEDGTHGAAWKAAVDATAGRVLTHDGDVVRAYYSSSNGGMSSAGWDIWGSDPDAFPYLAPVDTSAWDTADGVDNPRHRWSYGYTNEQLAGIFGLDEFTSIEVVERAPGGRPCLGSSKAHPCEPRDLDGDGVADKLTGGAVVTGVVGGKVVHQTFTAEGIRGKLKIFSGLIAIDGQEPPFEPPPVTLQRKAGEDRIRTAVALARAGWSTSDVAVLARADDPSDALAGSGLAGSFDAPLLLTTRDGLADAVVAELGRLGVSEVVLLGGEAALGPAVAARLDELEIAHRRVAGPDRFATAVAIATELDPGPDAPVLLVRGAFAGHPERIWPDALAVSGLAARRAGAGTPWPVLATADVLPDVTRHALEELAPSEVRVIGGTAIVPESVVADLQAAGIEVTRVGGEDRYATSRLVAALDDPSGARLALATGQNFPDGLAAGAFAARTGAVLLLVPRDHDPAGTPWLENQHPAYLTSLGWEQAQVTVVGGSQAVTDDVARAVKSLLTSAATTGDGDG